MEKNSKTVIIEGLADILELNRNPVVALRQVATLDPEIKGLIMKAIADDKTTKEIMEDLQTIFGDYGPWLAEILTSEAEPEFIGKVLRDTTSVMRVVEELEAERAALLKNRRNLARFLILILGVMSAAFSRISELLWYMILQKPHGNSLSFGLIGAAFTVFMAEEVKTGLRWLIYFSASFLITIYFLGNLFG
ncbi:MAG: hypothetical protein DRN92_04995 [Thermoproteota archaeon]|nr:MAG: hypothetical protein DRN92_04995 [Candidatus Korarchaeota archaeon]